jgi:hypothetical protein
MAISPNVKSVTDLLASTKQKVLSRTGLNNFDSDSKIRVLAESLVDEQVALQRELTNTVDLLQLSTTRGQALTEYGSSRGVDLLDVTFASVDASELNLAFYVESGTFGAINSAANITLPVGETISSDPNGNELGALIEYTLTSPLVCVTGDTIAYASARAKLSGSVANVGTAVLVRHSFTGYTDSANNTLKVINFYPILNGRDRESEDSYKFRIAKNYNTLAQNSETKIKLTNLKVPGVLDTRFVNGLFGIGTVGVVVLSADYESNPSLIAEVQSRLDRFKGPVGTLVAVPASKASFDFELKVKASKELSILEKAALKTSIQKTINQYFKSLSLGGLIRIDELVSLINANYRGSIRFERLGKNLFKNIYVSRNFSGSASNDKDLLIATTFQLDVDEFAKLNTVNIEYEISDV